uniref:Uncharacterized protein n=1 Tax=Avena sativa TaxID=4498 RepID=A0ACD6AGM5_AVESA
MHHLVMACPFSRQVWHEVLSWLRLPCQAPSDEPSLLDWWQASHRSLPKPIRKGLASITLLTPWMIWKHRNSCVLHHTSPSVRQLLIDIKEETAMWMSAGAKGLRFLVPMTWDVH